MKEPVKVVLFETMSLRGQIEHIEKMIRCGIEACKEQKIYLAEIVDMFDIWAPWMLEQIKKQHIADTRAIDWAIDYKKKEAKGETVLGKMAEVADSIIVMNEEIKRLRIKTIMEE